MSVRNWVVRAIVVSAALLGLSPDAGADDLRNVKKGEPVPAYRLPTLDGSVVDSETLKGSTVVIVCLSAEQRRSELASLESFEVCQAVGGESLRLVQVTADVIQRSYFESFRAERAVTAPLAFDADRSFYGKLGLIVLPTTIVVDKEGRLAHVISLHSGKYKHELEAYIRHTLGELSDAALDEQLKTTPTGGTPKSLASAHRALARSMREKGLLDTAKAELEKAREQDPGDHEILLDLADLDLALRDLDGAEALVAEVLAAQPNHRRAQQIKGIVCFERGDMDEAERLLTDALKLNPDPERAHYYLGRLLESRGDIEGAAGHYRAALEHLLAKG
ncbi:MAG: tetratricopeptide repeat protein [Phycisphaerales bacterium]|nr:tetratricopeptide repeat protein [Phycisphaerales bacterium]